MTIIISHSHFVHVELVSILVFQTFELMIFGRLSFPVTRWYVTVQDLQLLRHQKKFGKHWFGVIRKMLVMHAFSLFSFPGKNFYESNSCNHCCGRSTDDNLKAGMDLASKTRGRQFQ